MDHFAYVVLEKSDNLSESLDESIFPGLEITETDQDTNVITIPLPRELNEDEQDEYANRLADYMFEQGHEEFDIYLNNDDDDITEVTYEGDDFFEEFGTMWYNDDDVVDEAEYQGRKVKLGKPMRGDVKKFKVYVKNEKGNVIKVNFGHGGTSAKRPTMRIRKSNPKARKSFRARHNCDNPGPKTKARYWSCRKW